MGRSESQSQHLGEYKKTTCRYQDLNHDPSLDHLWKTQSFQILKLEEY